MRLVHVATLLLLALVACDIVEEEATDDLDSQDPDAEVGSAVDTFLQGLNLRLDTRAEPGSLILAADGTETPIALENFAFQGLICGFVDLNTFDGQAQAATSLDPFQSQTSYVFEGNGDTEFICETLEGVADLAVDLSAFTYQFTVDYCVDARRDRDVLQVTLSEGVVSGLSTGLELCGQDPSLCDELTAGQAVLRELGRLLDEGLAAGLNDALENSSEVNAQLDALSSLELQALANECGT